MSKLPILERPPFFLFGSRIRVHWNIHKNCYSVALKAGLTDRLMGIRQGWKVVALVKNLYMASVKFLVSSKGRARGIRLGKKVVHAWVEGVLEHPHRFYSHLGDHTPIAYNPKRAGTFMAFPGQPGPWMEGGGAVVSGLQPGGILRLTSELATPADSKGTRRPIMTGVWANPYKAPAADLGAAQALQGRERPLWRKPQPPPAPKVEQLDQARVQRTREALRIRREVSGMPSPYSVR